MPSLLSKPNHTGFQESFQTLAGGVLRNRLSKVVSVAAAFTPFAAAAAADDKQYLDVIQKELVSSMGSSMEQEAVPSNRGAGKERNAKTVKEMAVDFQTAASIVQEKKIDSDSKEEFENYYVPNTVAKYELMNKRYQGSATHGSRIGRKHKTGERHASAESSFSNSDCDAAKFEAGEESSLMNELPEDPVQDAAKFEAGEESSLMNELPEDPVQDAAKFEAGEEIVLTNELPEDSVQSATKREAGTRSVLVKSVLVNEAEKKSRPKPGCCGLFD